MLTLCAIACYLTQPVPAARVDGTWRALPSLPMAISNNAATSVVHGDGSTTLYSFMGIEDPLDQESITPASFRLDIGPDGSPGDWRRIADAPRLGGFAKIGASAIAVGDRVFLIGGYTAPPPPTRETTEHRLFEYLPDEDRYVRRADVPTEVDDTVVGVYQDRFIFVVSGWHGPINNNTRSVQFYDVQSDTWTQATQIPGPGLFGHAGDVVGDRIVFADGVVVPFAIASRAFVGTIDADNPASIDWREIDAHPGRATYRAAASQGGDAGEVIIVGGTDNPYNISGTGYNGEASHPLDQVMALDPISGAWRTLRIAGNRPATMDHRALVRVGHGDWAIIGGMREAGVATGACWLLDRE